MSNNDLPRITDGGRCTIDVRADPGFPAYEAAAAELMTTRVPAILDGLGTHTLAQ